MAESENLVQLRKLVNEMDADIHASSSYQDVLKNVQHVINNEMKTINAIKRKDIKLERYETICKSILSIIASANV